VSDTAHRFDRLPATPDDRAADDGDQPTREEVVRFFADRYGIAPAVFEPYSFWERGKGKIWAVRGELDTPVEIEGLGMTVLRTRREHWKPTLSAAQRFGDHADRNVLVLDRAAAATFFAGEDQPVPEWDGEWGYLLVAHDLAGERAVLGVGLYIDGELRSQVPKGRRRDLRA
jgi:NOL1/NOP2/fmu family ribosome biogenesis protein